MGRSTNNNENFENTFISNNDDNNKNRTINYNNTLRNSGSYQNIQSNSRYSNDFNNSYNTNLDNKQQIKGLYNNSNMNPNVGLGGLKENHSTLNIEALEKQLSDIERTKKEVAKYLDAIRAERGSLESKSNSNYEISKLVQENQTLKSDNIIFREDLSRLTELNQRLEEDLVRQRNRK